MSNEFKITIMKKLVLSLTAFLAVGAYAQQRTILVEAFSQASCGPCVNPNAALQTLHDANPTKFIPIKYQVSWPGVDPMNAQNPTDVASRVTYYNVTGVPSRSLDGTVTPVANVTQATIDARYAVQSPISLSVSHTMNPDFTANVTVTISAPAVWNPANTVLHLALIEKNITFTSAPGSNGETVFKNVMRKMLPNPNGTAVDAANFAVAGGSQTFTFNNVAMPSYLYKLSEVGFIAWVQNNTSKEVHQAGISDPVQLSNYGVIQSVSVGTNYSCATDLTGASVVLQNQGNTPITSATVNYQINAGAVQTAPFTGNIAPNGTSSFNLPNVTVPSGAHLLTTYLTNINGSGLNTPLGTQTASFARISASGTTGQMMQDFTNTAFPYANYYVTSPTGDNWVRATPNGGCIRYSFYAFTSGKIGEVYLAPVNMASNSAKAMTFDVAYRQYETENDRLEVLVSTDCGANWTSVYNKQGSTLATIGANTANYTTPAASDWRKETVNLTSVGSSDKLIVKFKATSAYGNNLFIDNIMIGGTLATVEFEQFPVQIYPNPANQVAHVGFEAAGKYSIVVTDIAGRVVGAISNTATGAVTEELNLSTYTSGSYLITIESQGQKTTKSLIVE